MPVHKDGDAVAHPAHYNSSPSGVECIDVAKHMGFCLGNALKYIWRADLKGGVEDLRKAIWYIQAEIDLRESAAAEKPTTMEVGSGTNKDVWQEAQNLYASNFPAGANPHWDDLPAHTRKAWYRQAEKNKVDSEDTATHIGGTTTTGWNAARAKYNELPDSITPWERLSQSEKMRWYLQANKSTPLGRIDP